MKGCSLVSEGIIDEVITIIGKEQDYPIRVEALMLSQPELMAYLLSDTFEILLDKEQELLLFMTLVIVEASKTRINFGRIREEDLGQSEELNYALMESQKVKDFSKMMDIFFEGYEQEDLLAFVEDSLMDDSDSDINITKAGKIPLAVGMKSIIDVISNGDPKY